MKSFETPPNTISSKDWLDPIEPSVTDLDQQKQLSAAEKEEPAVGSGRVISPDELERQLMMITTRDDAHRLVDAAPEPPPRCV